MVTLSEQFLATLRTRRAADGSVTFTDVHDAYVRSLVGDKDDNEQEASDDWEHVVDVIVLSFVDALRNVGWTVNPA